MLYTLTTSKEVIGRIIRNTRIQDTSYIVDMSEWIGEVVGFLKTKMALTPKSKCIEVCFHTGHFPTGLHTLTGVYHNGHRIPMRGKGCGDWYDVIPGGLQTSICDGTIEIHYLALPMDDEEFPLIPDDEDYKQAIYWYVRFMMIGAGYEDKVFTAIQCNDKFELHAARAKGKIRYPSVEMMTDRIPSITRYLPASFNRFFGLSDPSDCGDSGSGLFGSDFTPNGGQNGGAGGGTGTSGGGGTIVITNTVIEKSTQFIYRNINPFTYIATGNEGSEIIIPELIGKIVLELFLNSYLLEEERSPTIAITPNSFRFDKLTGQLSFYNDFTPQQIVQGTYTTLS